MMSFGSTPNRRVFLIVGPGRWSTDALLAKRPSHD